MMLSRKLQKDLLSRAGSVVLCAAMGASALASSACNKPADGKPLFTETKTFAGGIEVTARALNEGRDAYMLYCYACHGPDGDGKGPAAYGLRPPPRDFTKGIFKFARLRSGEDLPTDDDLTRIVRGGLHGTAMLPWDVPEVELEKILQYIKTFAPQKWEKKKKSGEPVKTIDDFAPSEDPWIGKETEAVQSGKELYHLRAECVTCHPTFETKEETYKMSVVAAKRDPDKYKVLTGFRDDPFGAVAKDSAEYGVKILPPDFTYTPVRSIHPGEGQLTDIYRVISYGVFPIMPAWKGAGLSEKDIWALAHYVKSLIALRGTPAADALKMKLNASASWVPPAPEAEPTAAPAPDSSAPPADKKDDKKDGDKKDGDKKGDKKGKR
jgi:mono/diheme cytochrome c family protein